ncbi:probable phospholipid-transporting ATPase VA isoform X2 [Copidosoma floridanum]|uniref:probable phospholipid-transporting ATPase VA isoform X2 n=1 Tax=Copidosoma floridanum TaxID=29053 RepID=UPI0006C96863|nr:probable phospholipid-transporting ATPase VA isoform X2 [Copidosoma floridanum]
MSGSCVQEEEEEEGETCEEPEPGRSQHYSLYVFPSQQGQPGLATVATASVAMDSSATAASTSRGHARSVSHGGVASMGVPQARPAPAGRASALKKPGHKRAFSQGQLLDMQPQQPGIAGQQHSRVGSKTDFILPPSHREDPPRLLADKMPSFRGHSRQASRSESIYTIRRSAAPPWWRRAWARWCGSTPEEPLVRTITPSHLSFPPHADAPARIRSTGVGVVVGARDNRIRTTKYSALSFLPRNLLEQFRRVANLYFIFIVLLNWVPAINAFGKEIAMIPVVFVLGVTALKDFFEDRRRLASDRRVNNSTCRVYTSEGDRYVKTAWKDVKVGDFIHLSNNEPLPADLLLLRSSDPHGFAFIDTCNLDGETNLKQRQVVRGFSNLQETFQPSKFRSVIEVDKPSTKIYRFHGAVVHPDGTRVPVSTENLLLRECYLKNTDFIEGIVIYVGHETKAMLNNGGPRYKRSRLEQQMNIDVVWCVVILIILCIVGAVGCKFWLSAYASVPAPFLPIVQDASYEGMLTFWTFVIILQVMIPLSLYVTIEMAKLGQVYHIMCDRELYDEETDRTAECRALNITEELGQVQYIFSDKTGTLTENKMLFRRCAVGGQDYIHTGDGENLVPCTRLKEDLLIGTYRHKLQEFLILLAICNTVVVNYHPHHDNMNSSGVIEDPQPSNANPKGYIRFTESKSATPATRETISNTIPLVSTSQAADSQDNFPTVSTVENLKSDDTPILRNKTSRPRLLNLSSIPSLGMLTRKLSPLGLKNNFGFPSEKNGKSPSMVPSTPAIYEAESPDELALVNTARAYNVRLMRRTAQDVTISLPDKSSLTFEVLKVLPFDSNRKCMSIVVRQPHTGEIVLYSKGADSTILGSLSPTEEDSPMTARVKQQVAAYAKQGLRTLMMARRSLAAQDFKRWMELHAELEATGAPGESGNARERQMRESYANLECQLSLLGATGIEDKLQSGVPESVASLVSAGIVVWLVTGDKLETAVNVAYSAHLFSSRTQQLRLQARSKSTAESLIRGYLETVERENRSWQQLPPHQKSVQQQSQQWAIVVDGKTLTIVLDPRSGLTGPFLELTRACSSVLACRATPLQKAYIVKVVKEQLGVRTLAIGDGANDVSMIQTADVGIGLSGQEGLQAVMAADFAIAKFYMLTRLLLVHGHWSYDRLSRMVKYFFYKNAICVFLIFWYQLYCGFSGTVMIDQIYLFTYNLVFTSLPPLILGVYDQIAPANLLIESPRLYERSRLASVYQPHSFWITMADALYQSIVIFFLTEAVYYDSDVDIWEFGTTITTCCIVVTLMHICLEIKSWTLIHIAAILASLGGFFSFSFLYNAICINCLGLSGSYWVMQKAIGRHIYWLTVILASVLAVLPRIFYKAIKNTVSPDIIHRANAACKFSQRVTGTRPGWSQSQHATIRTGHCNTKTNVLSTIVT